MALGPICKSSMRKGKAAAVCRLHSTSAWPSCVLDGGLAEDRSETHCGVHSSWGPETDDANIPLSKAAKNMLQ